SVRRLYSPGLCSVGKGNRDHFGGRLVLARWWRRWFFLRRGFQRNRRYHNSGSAYSIPFLSLRGQVVAGRLSLAVVRLQKVYTGPGTGGVQSRWHLADLLLPYLFHQ